MLDLSSAAGIQDMRPSRLALLLALARQYIAEFFDQNPLGQMGVILMRNGVAERLTELSGGQQQGGMLPYCSFPDDTSSCALILRRLRQVGGVAGDNNLRSKLAAATA